MQGNGQLAGIESRAHRLLGEQVGVQPIAVCLLDQQGDVLVADAATAQVRADHVVTGRSDRDQARARQCGGALARGQHETHPRAGGLPVTAGARVRDGSAQHLLGSFGQFVECVDHPPAARVLKFHQPQRAHHPAL